MAQLNQFDVPANVTTDNTAMAKCDIKPMLKTDFEYWLLHHGTVPEIRQARS